MADTTTNTEQALIENRFTPENLERAQSASKHLIVALSENGVDLSAALLMAERYIQPLLQGEEVDDIVHLVDKLSNRDIQDSLHFMGQYMYGETSLVGSDSRMGALAQEAFERYNEAYPNEQIAEMPLIVMRDDASLPIGLMYQLDVILVAEGFSEALDDDALRSVLVHELRHKWQMSDEVITVDINFETADFKAQEEQIAIACTASGMSASDIDSLMGVLRGEHENMPDLDGITLSDNCEYEVNDFAKLKDDMKEVSNQRLPEYAAARETDADIAAKTVDTSSSVDSFYASGVYLAEQLAIPHSEAFEKEAVHGTTAERIREAGCDIIYDGDSSELICPTTPDHAEGESRER